MSRHAPEPWRYTTDDIYAEIWAEQRTLVGDTHAPMINGGVEVSNANARRIVACVNACEGSETETLEKLGKDFVQPLIDLIDQRDELLAALKYHQEQTRPIQQTIDAIAKCEVRERPNNCRNRLRDDGKPYPKSGCAHCKTGGLTGCPFEGK